MQTTRRLQSQRTRSYLSQGGLVLVAGLTLVTACTTTSQDQTKTRPPVQVIGHGTKPGTSWAGVSLSIPLPGQSPSSARSSSEPTSSDKGLTLQ